MTKIIKLQSHLIYYNLALFSRAKRVWLMRICGLGSPLILITLQYSRLAKGHPLDWKLSIPGSLIAVACLIFVVMENRSSKKLSATGVTSAFSIVPAVYALGLIAAGLIMLARYAVQ